jgi:23S rRNA (pseudouridine1915-N3)-methyltransferase
VNRQIREKEGERILKNIRGGSYVIAMAIEGKMYDSLEPSDHIRDLGIRGQSHLTFIIGGSLGLSDQVLQRADEKISFSKLTFPHQLMRVILLEQIYRSYKIMNHEPYHK